MGPRGSLSAALRHSGLPVLDGALCAQVDPELWFPKLGSPSSAALLICQDCPARVDCLEWALTAREEHGIWGGMTPRQRRDELRRRRAGDSEGLGSAA
jgi:hypothetical protein